MAGTLHKVLKLTGLSCISMFRRGGSTNGLPERMRQYCHDRGEEIFGGPCDQPLIRISTGRQSTPMRWNHSTEGPLIVRAWAGKRPGTNACCHAGGNRALAEAGLRVPEILHADSSRETLEQYGMEILIEQCAPGERLRRSRPVASPELLERVARELARLHRRTAETFGRPWDVTQTGEERRAEMRQFLDCVEQRAAGGLLVLKPEDLPALVSSVKTRLENLDWSRAYLIHGDFFGGNLHVDETKQLWWLDFKTVEYSFRSVDLVSAMRWLGMHDQFDAFARWYEDETGTALETLTDELRTIAQFTLLRKMCSRIRKLQRLSPSDSRRNKLKQEQIEFEETVRALETGQPRDVLTAASGRM